MAGTKLADLATELTAPTFEDLLYVVTDPEGTPADRKMTIRTLRQHYNVMDYGAVADGSTDDLAAFQAAVAAAVAASGGVVYVPVGTYRLSARLDITTGVSLIGQDMTMTRLVLDHNAELLMDAWAILCGATGADHTDIHLANFSVYASNNIDPASPITQHSVVGFERVTRCSARNIYLYNGSAGIQLKNCEQFVIDNILAENLRDYTLAFLSTTRYGVVSNVTCKQVGEVLDFGPGNSDIAVSNVQAYGNYPDREEEAIDFAGASRITITNAMIYGDWRVGVNLKWERDSTPSDCTFENVQLYLTNTALSRGFFFVCSAPPEPEFHNIRLINCVAECAGTANDRGAICGTTKLRIDGLFVQGGRYHAGRQTIDCASDTAVWMKNVVFDGVTVTGDVTQSAGFGIALANCYAPVIRNCRVGPVGNAGVFIKYDSTAGLDATQKIVGAIIDNNMIQNHGGQTASAAIYVYFGTIDAAETYNCLRICGNTIVHDNDAALHTTHDGIKIELGDLAGLDYVKIDNNLIYRIPDVLDYAALGGNSTEANNTTYEA